jgi:hypothetical protein
MTFLNISFVKSVANATILKPRPRKGPGSKFFYPASLKQMVILWRLLSRLKRIIIEENHVEILSSGKTNNMTVEDDDAHFYTMKTKKRLIRFMLRPELREYIFRIHKSFHQQIQTKSQCQQFLSQQGNSFFLKFLFSFYL